ncbi:hypothetical protein [Dactylosporangium sp. NPDC049140]|uniref:hypothetical protein n=1 Tax=Dactylosporangium sp. NPDC049140 TaxID=3155647 RepID=UPI0033C83613
MATNALEEIAYQLSEMSDEERRDFDAAISRIAAAHDKGTSQGPAIGSVTCPGKLGLT